MAEFKCIFKDISNIFASLQIYPDSGIKLKNFKDEKYEEVEIFPYVFRNGFYPELTKTNTLNNKNLAGDNQISYFKKKRYHRDNDLPAITEFDYIEDDGYYTEEIYKSREEYYQNGETHREDGPAIIEYDQFGNVTFEAYFQNNMKNRRDGPAVTKFQDGKIILEIYSQNGKKHREDGPALIEYENSNIKYEIYFQNGKKHREGNPAQIEYTQDGNVKSTKYFQNGLLHREDGPAREYFQGNILHIESYFQKGIPKRSDGPTEVFRGPDGEIVKEYYY